MERTVKMSNMPLVMVENPTKTTFDIEIILKIDGFVISIQKLMFVLFDILSTIRDLNDKDEQTMFWMFGAVKIPLEHNKFNIWQFALSVHTQTDYYDNVDIRPYACVCVTIGCVSTCVFVYAVYKYIVHMCLY